MSLQCQKSLMPFTLTDYPQFYGLEMSLSKIMMIGLFRLNNRMVVFSKTEKKFISQQTRKGSYIYNVHTEGDGGILKICHVFANYFVFKQKIYCSFLQQKIYSFLRMEGVEVTNLAIFCGRHKCMTANWFKTTTN